MSVARWLAVRSFRFWRLSYLCVKFVSQTYVRVFCVSNLSIQFDNRVFLPTSFDAFVLTPPSNSKSTTTIYLESFFSTANYLADKIIYFFSSQTN